MDVSDWKQSLGQSARQTPWRDLLAAAAFLSALLLITDFAMQLPWLPIIASAILFVSFALILTLSQIHSRHVLGPADRVTLARAVLVLFLASLTLQPDLLARLIWPFALLCVVALLLDGVDGHIARKTGTSSAFGARFDMELDAFFILLLCFAALVLDKAGPWVLLIGLIRYGFVVAAFAAPFLNDPLPESFRRKTVCVWQLVTLMIALLPVTPLWLASGSLLVALILLCWSFAIDVRYLMAHRNQPRRTP
ncbi:CDP-alcohol phosphatidyltransferase family protein [uncultured Marinobacter sp.]|uniref:CDP-alcohol phosphatidyltransferase family protein n=1 Tax=uncultured Marinobacter sp. TaxID=187379 RepID=UPI0030DCD882